MASENNQGADKRPKLSLKKSDATSSSTGDGTEEVKSGKETAGELKKPATGLSLSPPAGNNFSKNQLETLPLSASGGKELKKPGAISPGIGAGITLKKPSDVAAELKLQPPGGHQPPGGLELKKPTEVTPKLSSPALIKPKTQTPTSSPADPPHDESAIGLKISPPAEAAPINKLTAPGNLNLKKSTESTDGTGLRLRKASEPLPNEDMNASGIDLKLTDPAVAPETASTGLDTTELKLRKKEGRADKTGERNVVMPGIDIPPPSESEADDPGVIKTAQFAAVNPEDNATMIPMAMDSELAAGTTTPIEFARKKSGMSKQTKIQLMWIIPLVLIVAILGSVLMYNLLFLTKNPVKEEESVAPPPSAAKPSSSSNAATTPANDSPTPSTPVTDTTDDFFGTSTPAPVTGIALPQELLEKLTEAFGGEEGKEKFLQEWEKLTDEERKAYLIETGFWTEATPAPIDADK